MSEICTWLSDFSLSLSEFQIWLSDFHASLSKSGLFAHRKAPTNDFSLAEASFTLARAVSIWQRFSAFGCGGLPPFHHLLEIFAACFSSSSGGFFEISDLARPSCSFVPPPLYKSEIVISMHLFDTNNHTVCGFFCFFDYFIANIATCFFKITENCFFLCL